MKTKFLAIYVGIVIVLSLSLSSCSSVQQMIQGTSTFTPTNTQTPSPTYTPTSTLTLTPTATLTSTPTPNATATEFANRSDLMYQEIQDYVKLGYLSESNGSYTELPDFEEDFAQINWYQWWTTDFLASNFVFSARFSWDTANDSPYISGCGLALVPKSDPYIAQVFILHRSKVVVLNSYGYDVRPQKGTGHVDIPSPYDADFTLIAKGSENMAYVLVNNKFVGKYKLHYSPSSLGYVIFSGTSKDYGTHCKISDARAWKIK